MTFDITTTVTDTPSGMLRTQPADPNFLSPLGFRFSLKRSPMLNFFATDANIPSFEIGWADLPTPFKNLMLPGDKPSFGDFILTFKVDEKMSNYLEIYTWLCKIGFPENFEQYASVKNTAIGSGEGVVSDGTLTILNSSMAPRRRLSSARPTTTLSPQNWPITSARMTALRSRQAVPAATRSG